MKLEIIRKFSSIYLKEMFYVQADGWVIYSTDAEEDAHKLLKETKESYLKSQKSEVIYTEEL